IGESAQAFAQRQEKYRRLKETLSQHYTARLFEQDCAALNEALNPTEPHVLQAVKQPSDPHAVLAEVGPLIATRLSEAVEAVGRLTEAGHGLAAALGEGAPEELAAAARLATLAALAATDPRPHETWLSWERVNELVDEAREACRKRERAAAVRAELSEEFSDGFLELPLVQWRLEFQQRYASIPRIFHREYRRRMK